MTQSTKNLLSHFIPSEVINKVFQYDTHTCLMNELKNKEFFNYELKKAEDVCLCDELICFNKNYVFPSTTFYCNNRILSKLRQSYNGY